MVVRAELVQSDRPEWGPLRQVLPETLVETFMWMFALRLGGQRIHAYKHVVTRRYVHLTESGTAYDYLGEDRYAPIPVATALELALTPWWAELGASPAETAAARSAIAALREEGR